MATGVNRQELQNQNKVPQSTPQINPAIIQNNTPSSSATISPVDKKSGQPQSSQIQEWTWGGNNYNLNKDINQLDNQQGHFNALNGTGHVAGLQERQIPVLNIPQEAPQPTEEIVPSEAAPVVTTGVTRKKTIPTVTKPQEPEGFWENGVWYKDATDRNNKTNGAEFGYGNRPQEEQPQEQGPNEEAIKNMEDKLNESTAGKIYGKVTADQNNIINTLEDDNNIYKSMNDARIQSFKNLQSMSSQDIATSIYYGMTPYGEQGMRDLMQFDPTKYSEVQEALKKMYTQDEVNNISNPSSSTGSTKTGVGTYVESLDKNMETDITNWEKNMTQSTGYEEVTGILDTKLASNETATTAKQEMMNIKKDIADLEQQLEDLPKIAPKLFKGDVPDYIYKAFIANNQQKIQSELSKLQSRYSGLSDIYKTEVANSQWELEYDLKKQEFNRQLTNDSWDKYYKETQLELDRIKRGTDSKGNMVAFKVDPTTGQMYQISDGTAFATYQDAVSKTALWAQSQVGQYTGLECTGFTNKISEGLAGVRMIGNNGAATAEEKVAYATNPSVSDYIPVAGDVAVMTNNGKNGVSQKWGHTMRVDKVYTDNNGDTWFHYIATNKYGKDKEYTYGYQGDMRVSDFYKNGGAGFWNPFKQAQYNNRSTSTNTQTGDSPLEGIINDKINSGKLTATQLDNISRFGYSYAILWRSKELGELDALLNQNMGSTFLQQLSMAYINTQSGQSTDKVALSKGKITLDQFITELEGYAAKQFGEESLSYMGFMEIVGLIEQKLRKESGAAINGSEWAMNFAKFLPQASDTQYQKQRKLSDLETWLKYRGKASGITEDYSPIFDFDFKKSRKYD